MTTNTNALYALRMEGNNENGYLLWLRGGTLVAQDFDTATLKLGGELHPVANPVSKMPVSGQMQVAVSATGILLYSASNPSSQYMWLDRAGKPLRTVGEPTDIGFFRLAPDGRRVVVSRASPGGNDLWMLEVERGVASRFTSRPGTNIDPVWSCVLRLGGTFSASRNPNSSQILMKKRRGV